MFKELWTNHDQYDAMVTSAWGDILGYKNILTGGLVCMMFQLT
jgi:hypothetical protein